MTTLPPTDEIELKADSEMIAIRSDRRVRQDWEAQFRRMAVHGDDALVDDAPSSVSAWDDEEWVW
ncbi:MAG: hypothetical protein K1X65_24925 [Caldilineales bacterium]|nr:hypothetical protein [Caldilineales bacterium]MCW5858614.1 hypothetical protein [Caldilineales bacterium]